MAHSVPNEDVARAGIIVRAKGLLPFRIENPVRPDGHNERKYQAQDSDEFAESQLGNNRYIAGIGCRLWGHQLGLYHTAQETASSPSWPFRRTA